MATPYTSSYGAGVKGTGQQQFVNALNSITGNSNMNPEQSKLLAMATQQAPYLQNTQQQLTQEAGIPGLVDKYGDEAKLMDMFAHDQTLNQKYGQGQAGQVLGTGTVAPTSMPALTSASNSLSYSGLTDPSAITKAMGMDVSGHSNVMDLITKAVNYQAGAVQDQVRANATAYKAVMDALSTIATLENQKQIETMKVSASLGFGDLEEATQAYVEQVKGGLNIENIPQDYRTKVVKALTAQGWTTEKIKRNLEGKQTLGVLKAVKEMWDTSMAGGVPSGGPYGVSGIVKEQMGNLKIEPDVGNYLRYKNAIISTLRGLVGEKGILSNQDMSRIQDLLPDYRLTTSQAQKNWNLVRQLLNSKYGEDITSEYFGPETSPITSGTIKVRQKSTGKTGTIPANEFDETLYERI